jgi:hypothetical protein
MALTVSARQRWSGPSPSALIRVAAILAALGVALSITDDYATFGKWFAIIGVVSLIVALHRFGRLGPDAAIRFEVPPLPHKKKKKKKRKLTEPDTSSSESVGSSPSDASSTEPDASSTEPVDSSSITSEPPRRD